MLRARASLLAMMVWLASSTATAAPNIVFILLDDVGYGDLGVQGSAFVETPRIDAFAAEGLRFTRYYSSSSMCSPTRAAILTGQHPSALNLRRPLGAPSRRGLPGDVATLPGVLREAGYVTGHFGKWHVGRSRREHLPDGRGFDRFVIPASTDNGHYFDRALLIDDTTEAQSVGNVTEVITDYVLSFIQENRDRPFFANVWYNNAHRPYHVEARWADHYPDTFEGLYAALVSHADEQIGRILDQLRDLGLEQDTLVVITSDNGDAFDDDGIFAGRKGTVFEGGLRVPALVRWPGHLPAGAVNDQFFLSFDWLPTLAELAGVETNGLGLHGESVASAWLGGVNVAEARTHFWELSATRRAFESPTGEFNDVAVRDGPWKLVVTQSGNSRTQLFDLESDPAESNDLAASMPERVDELLLEYRGWRRGSARFEAPVASLQGVAAVEEDRITFGGGAAVLEANPRFDFHDGNFSFEAAVLATAIGPGEQMIASWPKSWDLVIDAAGRVRLEMQGGAGTSTVLVSQGSLRAGLEANLAFTVAGWREGPSTVRLYLDGRLQARTNEIDGGAEGMGSVRLGNDSTGARPLRGSIRDAAFTLASLSDAELNDRDADGVPRTLDNCTEEPNPLQIDSDADGFGNTCDADYDGSGRVMGADFLRLRAALNRRAGDPAYRPEMDWNSDGLINSIDYNFFRRRLGRVPGPSGLACAGRFPCEAR